jgi:hypothetical protein
MIPGMIGSSTRAGRSGHLGLFPAAWAVVAVAVSVIGCASGGGGSGGASGGAGPDASGGGIGTGGLGGDGASGLAGGGGGSSLAGAGGGGGGAGASAGGGGAGRAATGGNVGAGGSAGTGGHAGAGGHAGSSPGTGGTGGHAGGGGSAGARGSVGGGGSLTGGAGGGSGGAGAAGPFTCSLVIGNSTTQQWFDGGFVAHSGIDPTRWELVWVAHHYIDSWADPNDSGWSTALDMNHACSKGSTTPDRVIFIVTFAPPYPSEATYETDTTKIVNNIKAKYPGVKRVEIMTLVRSPGNLETACSSKANNEQSIPPAEDQAIAAVAANSTFAGLAFASPPFYVTSCSDFLTDAPQYTTAGATNVANVYGAYYAAHP